ncbi:hypothetical protein MRX96_010817 [Rhipicephalus microplus]
MASPTGSTAQPATPLNLFVVQLPEKLGFWRPEEPAETCEFGDLKKELIRNWLAVGLSDTQLSEKLQLNAELTLEAAITVAHNSETIKQQQKNLRQQ